MLIILETRRAEAAHHASLRILARAEEFARLYGVGQLSRQTVLEILGLRSERTPPLVFEGTPSRQPNALMEHWRRSVASVTAEQGGHAMRIRGTVASDLIYTDD